MNLRIASYPHSICVEARIYSSLTDYDFYLFEDIVAFTLLSMVMCNYRGFFSTKTRTVGFSAATAACESKQCVVSI